MLNSARLIQPPESPVCWQPLRPDSEMHHMQDVPNSEARAPGIKACGSEGLGLSRLMRMIFQENKSIA